MDVVEYILEIIFLLILIFIIFYLEKKDAK